MLSLIPRRHREGWFGIFVLKREDRVVLLAFELRDDGEGLDVLSVLAELDGAGERHYRREFFSSEDLEDLLGIGAAGLLYRLSEDHEHDGFLDGVAVERLVASRRVVLILDLYGFGHKFLRELRREAHAAHEEVSVVSEFLLYRGVLIAGAVVDGDLREPVELLHGADPQRVVSAERSAEHRVGVGGLELLDFAVEVRSTVVERNVGDDFEVDFLRGLLSFGGGVLTELGVLVDESEGLYAGVLLFVEVFDVVDEFDGFDGVGRGVAEEVLIAALGELSGARAAAEEYLLRAFGDGAGGLRRGAVVASDYREDAFLIIKTLCFRLRDVRFALVVGLDYLDDVLSAEESFSGGERRVDLGVGLVDEVGGGKDGINAVLSRDGGGAG